jgi:hypothetical protein
MPQRRASRSWRPSPDATNELHTVVVGECLAKDRGMLLEEVRITAPERLEQPRRALDVGEEEGTVPVRRPSRTTSSCDGVARHSNSRPRLHRTRSDSANALNDSSWADAFSRKIGARARRGIQAPFDSIDDRVDTDVYGRNRSSSSGSTRSGACPRRPRRWSGTAYRMLVRPSHAAHSAHVGVLERLGQHGSIAIGVQIRVQHAAADGYPPT